MVVVGGVIPPADFQALYDAGAALVFPPRTLVADPAIAVHDELSRRLGYSQTPAAAAE
jgi:methylmalonyl-CoA mutase